LPLERLNDEIVVKLGHLLFQLRVGVFRCRFRGVAQKFLCYSKKTLGVGSSSSSSSSIIIAVQRKLATKAKAKKTHSANKSGVFGQILNGQLCLSPLKAEHVRVPLQMIRGSR